MRSLIYTYGVSGRGNRIGPVRPSVCVGLWARHCAPPQRHRAELFDAQTLSSYPIGYEMDRLDIQLDMKTALPGYRKKECAWVNVGGA